MQTGKQFISAFLLISIFRINLTVAKQAPSEDDDKGPVVGIDLGTTYSCIGVFKSGRVDIIANEQGNRITPSYVAFHEGRRLVGEPAKLLATEIPGQVIYDAKRFIGRHARDQDVLNDKKIVPFDVIDRDGKVFIQMEENNQKKQLAPEEISAIVLSKMKEIASNYLGQPIKRAVITVPAYFNDTQRQATKDAGVIAGLNVLRIINEPTAAAIAYGFDKKNEMNILVFDLGGGTFDVSIMTIDNGIFEVMATSGDTHLGGEDFDHRLSDYVTKVIKQKHGVNISNNPRHVAQVKRQAEVVKRQLSIHETAELTLQGIGEIDEITETITRSKFEELCIDLFKKTLKPVERVLEDADVKKSQVDEIILVGGSTRIPKIRKLISEFFNDKEPNIGINPDEAVAYGAAVQAGILSGENKSGMVLLDVTPLTLGIETVGGVMTKIIPRNTVMPTKKSKMFSTHQDNQTSVTIQIYEGERYLTKDNHFLGQFDLKGIPPMPKNMPQVQVTIEVDANGITHITAEEQHGKTSTNITIDKQSQSLSNEDIEKMIKDAVEHEGEDKKHKDLSEARLALENYAGSIRDMLREKEKYKDKLSAEDLSILEEQVNYVNEFIQSNPNAEVDQYKEILHQAEEKCSPIMSKLYGGAGSPPGADMPGGAPDMEDEL